MMNFYVTIGLVFLLAWTLSDTAQAEATSASPQPLALSPVRDPFTPSTLMYDAASAGNTASGYGFLPSQGNSKIPEIKLRGLMNQNGEFIALLEIKGFGTYIVREGDEFTIDPNQPKSAIRIDKITRLSITMETGMLGSIRVLR
jgi:hypothetical protein